MRAVIVHAAKDLRIGEVETGEPSGGQVRVRIEAGGICGSDLHYFHEGRIGTITLKQPMVLGHEVAGRIESLGADVAGLQVGDRVALNPSRPCGACRFCRDGEQIHCLDMRFYGSAMRYPHVQGAFREAIVADATQCHVVPASLSAGEAAMAEPFAVCLHAVNRAGPMLGKRVLVTGSGPIGALCVLAARRAGAAEIVATDLSEAPAEVVLKLGADRFINVARHNAEMQAYAADKGQFDVLLEASGSDKALAAAFELVRPRGVIVQVGIGGMGTLPLNLIVAKEFDLRGTFRFHAEFALAVTLIAKRLVDVRPLITATLPFTEATAAFTLASDRQRAMKVQLAFG
ncbi:MAG: L-idonate 5-dehydrogenase [Hyphomicrobiaceae bacterium]